MATSVHEIVQHFKTVGSWVDWGDGKTCDGIKAGDPDTVITGIAVAWQALQSNLEEAYARGCNLFITHEPTFYTHMDNDPGFLATPAAQRKAEWLMAHKMVVYRCHDVWDVYPKLGIVDAWSDFLGLGTPISRAKYYNLHQIPSTTAWELVLRIKQKLSTLDEQAVQFVGKRWQMVHNLVVGTGAITDVRKMIDMGADVVLATDDGISYWQAGAYAADLGIPLIVVNHCTAEIPGLQNLAAYLAQQFPEVPVQFIGPKCTYEIAAVETSREIGIRMRLDDLNHLPEFRLPDGYELHSMPADETRNYVDVMNHSNYTGECDQAWFEREFSNDPLYDPAHLVLIWHQGTPVAAAAGWQRSIEGQEWGLVHWVGVVESERNRGLGKAITLAALYRIKQRGFTRAMLHTQPWRIPAIATYLGLGFEPWYTPSASQQVWNQVMADLQQWREDLRR